MSGPRPVTLTLDVHPDVIFCAWTYRPRLRGLGQSVEVIHPGGALHDLDFERLRLLGSGVHEVALDEKVQGTKGPTPKRTPAEQICADFRLDSFWCEILGNGGGSEMFVRILKMFSPEAAPTLLPMLRADHVAALRKYAARIPTPLTPEGASTFEIEYIGSHGGHTVANPPENLVAIRDHFA